jgi:hypothetical protein
MTLNPRKENFVHRIVVGKLEGKGYLERIRLRLKKENQHLF